MTTETKSILDWIEENGISADIQPAPENPAWRGEPGDGMAHFAVTLRREGQPGSHCVYFSVGRGVVEQWMLSQPGDIIRRAAGNSPGPVDSKPSIKLPGVHYSVDSDEWGKRMLKNLAPKYRPELADVIDSMASDVSGIEGETFETWADSMGYNSDSISDKHTFEACLKERQQLIMLAGITAVNELCYDIERL